MAEKKQRKPTSTDVAELAGVSQTSVSLVLSGSSRATFSEQTRARVFEAARQLGYQPPAHRTRKKNGNDRRLILVLTPTLANQYYSELIQTLEDYAGSQEFRVLVCNTFRKRDLEKYYLEQFSDNRISGIVYTFLPSFPDEAVRLSHSARADRREARGAADLLHRAEQPARRRNAGRPSVQPRTPARGVHLHADGPDDAGTQAAAGGPPAALS